MAAVSSGGRSGGEWARSPGPDRPSSGGDGRDDPEPRRLPSLTSLLWRREQVARCSGALSAYLGTTVAEAEALLLSEARRREVSVGVLARRVLADTASARSWTAEHCPVCEDALQVEVLGGFGLERELVCPRHHDGALSAGLAEGRAPGQR